MWIDKLKNDIIYSNALCIREIIQTGSITFNAVLLSLMLVACSAAETQLPADIDKVPEEIFTEAAQTVTARKTELSIQLPTLPPEAMIKTIAVGTSTPMPTVTPTLSPTPAPPTQTFTPTPLTTQNPVEDFAVFVSDITIPDNTIIRPFEPFTKTWRIKNKGSTTWSPAYQITFVKGDLMGADAEIPLGTTVLPKKVVDISVSFVAPPAAGHYRGYWNLRNAQGQLIGMGGDPERAFWVDIEVSDFIDPDATGVPVAGSGIITSLVLEIDHNTAEATCPHIFTFTTEFNLKKQTALTYKLEMGATEGSLDIKLPLPVTKTYGVGTHKVTYVLHFSNDLKAWARFLISEPFELRSNEVQFSLDCR